MGHENSYQIAIKSLFWPKCWIASYNTQEATCKIWQKFKVAELLKMTENIFLSAFYSK
jgi:hypothetical protein